jgi:integrase
MNLILQPLGEEFMRTKPYSLWKRLLPSGKIVYYIRFRLDDGSWGVPKSSGQTKKTAAEAWAIEYLKSGTIVTRENITFKFFASRFFAWDSEYISSLRMRGRQIGQRHAENQQGYVDNYLLKAFGPEKLSRIDDDRIQELTLDLRERGLSASTINHILLSLRIILQWAYRKHCIQRVPDIEAVAGSSAVRGILNFEETKAVFDQPWKDSRYYTMNLLAATTGMRLGEILGLQRKAIHSEYLEVRTSWEKGKGLKGTKTGRPRFVPLVPQVSQALATILGLSPFTEPDDLVFFGRRRSAPLDPKMVQKSFAAALATIGIDESTRLARGLTFHSWRHFFNSLLINAKVPVLATPPTR